MQGVGVKPAGGGQLGSRFENAGDNHGNGQIALATRQWIEDGIEFEVA